MRGLNPVVGCDEWMTVTAKQIARPVEPLSPSDSIAHAVEQMRLSGLSVYPIVRNGTFVAMVSLETIDRYLERDWDFDIDRVRLSPVALTISDTVLIGVEQSTACIGGNYPISSATQVFRSVGDPDSLAVVEGNGTYVGLLVRSDLIAARIRTLAPHRMGGMATPLGVYLTDGINAGGAGTLGLMLTGVTLGLLGVAAAVIGGLFEQLIVSVWSAHHSTLSGALLEEMQSFIALPIMLLLIRFVPLAGYHAAEHQVVHCSERGEALTVSMVRSMPRVHPRCGTNIVAALTLFTLAMTIGTGTLQGVLNAILPSMLLTLAFWRPVGSFLQQYLTTRPASDKQIRAGISAAESLMRTYRSDVTRKSTMWLRIWRMGLLQVAMGWAMIYGLLEIVAHFVPAVDRYM